MISSFGKNKQKIPQKNLGMIGIEASMFMRWCEVNNRQLSPNEMDEIARRIFKREKLKYGEGDVFALRMLCLTSDVDRINKAIKDTRFDQQVEGFCKSIGWEFSPGSIQDEGDGIAENDAEAQEAYVFADVSKQETYAFADGSKYVGEMSNGKQHGQGTLTFANGDKYVGEFVNDKRHGQGTYTTVDGAKYVGEFVNGKQPGERIKHSFWG